MHPFASPLFRLARLARWRVVRMLACVLALSIATSGFAAAAMPLHGAVAMQAGNDACAHHAQAPMAKHVHRADGCCGEYQASEQAPNRPLSLSQISTHYGSSTSKGYPRRARGRTGEHGDLGLGNPRDVPVSRIF
jgi:hypothetical protein